MYERPVAERMNANGFQIEYVEATQRIRGAFTDALTSVGADASDPRDIVARLAIHRVVAWRLSKIATTTDPATPMRQLPGAPGMKILHKAFKDAGAPKDRLDAMQDAVAAYRQMVDRHAGNDAMLEVMLASRQDDPVFADPAVAMRKQAFEGAAAVWGACARLQLEISVVAPTHGHDELVDLAHLGGGVDFRRLRESVRWPFHVGTTISDEGEPIEPGSDARSRSSLVRQFCSTPAPEFDKADEGERTVYTIKPGAVGKTGMMTYMLERILPAVVSRYRDEENEFGQHCVGVQTPVELLQHDLLIHHDLSFALPPQAMLCGDTTGAFTHILLHKERCRLPLAEQVLPLGGRPPVLSTPDVPRITEMAEYLCAQVGRKLDEFTGYRLTMRYPPLSTVLFFSYPLMTR